MSNRSFNSKLVVHISGGLGNQMFQYMAGYALAKSTEKELLLNFNWFDNPRLLHRHNPNYLHKREIGIKAFAKVNEARVEWIPTPRDGRFERLTLKLSERVKRTLGIGGEEQFEGQRWIHGTEIKRLVGVFMSPRYFLDISPREVFELLVDSPSEWGIQTIGSITQSPAIGVHIRLGDYIRLGEILIPEEVYFLKGIELLKAKMKNEPKIFIFTDDPLRIAERFPSLAKMSTIVSPPLDSPPIESMMALSKCAAFVCSNSSFSWWGATLNNTDASLIVRPSYFYTAKPELDSHQDLWSPQSARMHPITGERVF